MSWIEMLLLLHQCPGDHPELRCKLYSHLGLDPPLLLSTFKRFCVILHEWSAPKGGNQCRLVQHIAKRGLALLRNDRKCRLSILSASSAREFQSPPSAASSLLPLLYTQPKRLPAPRTQPSPPPPSRFLPASLVASPLDSW